MTMIKPLFSIVSAPLVFSCCLLYGCGPEADSSMEMRESAQPAAKTGSDANAGATPSVRAVASGTEPVSTIVDARPAALVDGRSVPWTELKPILNEAAGALALREVILDRKIAEALRTRGITITPDAAAAERKLLLESLSSDPNVAMRLLDELRDRQDLGKARFDALMYRNAAMRAMVSDQVQISEGAVQVMYDIVHGPKRQARLMVLPDLGAAQGAINLVNSGVSFADVAVEMSTDSSAPRGGLLEPISRSDPAYPEAIRAAIWALNVGEISSPVLLESGYAVVLLVKRLSPGTVTAEAARSTMESLVRTSQERLLMDQLARTMLSQASVTIFDPELNDAWARARRGPK
jgi:hypothetical protein